MHYSLRNDETPAAQKVLSRIKESESQGDKKEPVEQDGCFMWSMQKSLHIQSIPWCSQEKETPRKNMKKKHICTFKDINITINSKITN